METSKFSLLLQENIEREDRILKIATKFERERLNTSWWKFKKRRELAEARNGAMRLLMGVRF